MPSLPFNTIIKAAKELKTKINKANGRFTLNSDFIMYAKNIRDVLCVSVCVRVSECVKLQ